RANVVSWKGCLLSMWPVIWWMTALSVPRWKSRVVWRSLACPSNTAATRALLYEFECVCFFFAIGAVRSAIGCVFATSKIECLDCQHPVGAGRFVGGSRAVVPGHGLVQQLFNAAIRSCSLVSWLAGNTWLVIDLDPRRRRPSTYFCGP